MFMQQKYKNLQPWNEFDRTLSAGKCDFSLRQKPCKSVTIIRRLMITSVKRLLAWCDRSSWCRQMQVSNWADVGSAKWMNWVMATKQLTAKLPALIIVEPKKCARTLTMEQKVFLYHNYGAQKVIFYPNQGAQNVKKVEVVVSLVL